jgi:flagellar protein FlbD
MIKLTRLNHVPLIVNADLIEHVEVTADTVVALTTGQKFMVLESAEEVVEKVIQYRKAILSASHCPLKIHSAASDEDAEHVSAGPNPAASWAK